MLPILFEMKIPNYLYNCFILLKDFRKLSFMDMHHKKSSCKYENSRNSLFMGAHHRPFFQNLCLLVNHMCHKTRIHSNF